MYIYSGVSQKFFLQYIIQWAGDHCIRLWAFVSTKINGTVLIFRGRGRKRRWCILESPRHASCHPGLFIPLCPKLYQMLGKMLSSLCARMCVSFCVLILMWFWYIHRQWQLQSERNDKRPSYLVALSTVYKWQLTEKEKPGFLKLQNMKSINSNSQDFLLVLSAGPVDKSPPRNARDSGSIPGQGAKISHAVELLSLHTTRESVQHNERFYGCKEDPTHRN